MQQGFTKHLSRLCINLKYENLPPAVIETAKHCLLDWIGVTLAGSPEPLAEILLSVALAEGSAEQATIIGTPHRVSTLQAALINGSSSHALDFDDVQERLHGHPTAPVAPVLLALAEHEGFSGRGVITALVAGIEAECRINVYMGESHYIRGWHSTATNGSFGAAVGAAHLLSFDAHRCALAMGLAGTQAAGLRAMFGTMAKPLHAGKAAYHGLFAAELIRRGFTSIDTILEASQGFGATQSDGVHPERALAGYGDRYEIEDTLFKYHAACHGVHAAVEALLLMRRKGWIDRDNIGDIEITLNQQYMDICAIEAPKTGLEGKFSLSFCAALAVLGEETSQSSTFSDEMVARRDIQEMGRKVRLNPRQDVEMKVAIVKVTTTDGKQFEQFFDVGVPATDLDYQWDKLVAKFLSCADGVISKEQAMTVVQMIRTLDQADDLSPLLEACRTAAALG